MRLIALPRSFSGPKGDFALEPDNLQWRTHRNDIPSRVAPRVFVAGGKVNSPIFVQIAQPACQSAAVRQATGAAEHTNTVWCLVLEIRHGIIPGSSIADHTLFPLA